MKNKKHSSASTRNEPAAKPDAVIVPDDRLGPDEPLDEATSPGVSESEEEISEHRVRNIEPDDEHIGEDLIEEGVQGYMHGSLTKPRRQRQAP